MSILQSVVNLFCLPYAGGSSSIYMKWGSTAPDWLHLKPIELSGRGTRFTEKLTPTLIDTVNDVYDQVTKFGLNTPYILFGHSMGSIIAYEVFQKILLMGAPQPIMIFFSGSKPPHLFAKENKITHLPDHEFLKEISEYGGTLDEVINDKELMSLFIPILKNDFSIIENYTITKKVKMNCEIAVLYGSKENLNMKSISQWANYTQKECSIQEFEGGHFFINECESQIIQFIVNQITSRIMEGKNRG